MPLSQGQARERQMVEAARVDPLAFDALYEQHVDAIFGYALQRVHDHATAEDVVSETFRRALENIGRYEWRGIPFSAWLYRIASSVIAAHYRQAPQASLDDAGDVSDEHPGPEEALLVGERKRDLLAAVGTLPPEQQQAVILRYGHEMRNKEIGYIMDRSEGAVKQLLHRAISSLQRRLDDSGVKR
jgi:RNA polymerase sigma-70 factor (ECF subfamily)